MFSFHKNNNQRQRDSYDTIQPASLQQPPQNDIMSDRLAEEENIETTKFCRICLDVNDPHSMISPCLCKGSSKWVHRSCLDLWRINEKDRAFAQCTECHYYYKFIPKSEEDNYWRKAKFYLFVSRDICFVTIALQICITFLGYITYLFDHNMLHSVLIDILDGGEISGQCHHDHDKHHEHDKHHDHDKDNTNDKSNNNGQFLWCHHQIAVYYLYGLFFFLAILGFVGCIVLCQNGCKIPVEEETGNDSTFLLNDDHMETGQQRSVSSSNQRQERQQQHRTNYYRRHRQQQQRRNYAPNVESNTNTCGESCCYSLDCCCRGCYYTDPCPYNSHLYFGPASDDCCCCCCCSSNSSDVDCCCCCDSGTPSSNVDCNCPTSTDSSDCNNECSSILLIIVLVVLIIMAIIGFVVGIFLGIILIQRILQRHMFRLQKKHLVEEFQVADLSKYDDISASIPNNECRMQYYDENTTTTSSNNNEKSNSIYSAVPLPPPPTNLSIEDATNLKKLGLLVDD